MRFRSSVIGACVALVVALGGCAAGPAATTTPTTVARRPVTPVTWVTSTTSLVSGGRTRTFLVARPSAVTAARLPVVVFLHGRNVTPQQELGRDGLESVVGRAILVYPAGYQQSWDAGACCAGAQADQINDLAFLTSVVHRVLQDQPDASSSQVYLIGYSNGGKMAYRLSCADPSLFAAVAVYGATETSTCTDRPDVSFLEVASTADPELTIGAGGTPQSAGGFVEPTVTAQAADYRASDTCGPTATATTAGHVAVTTWTTCRSGTRVGLALYAGGSHAWPPGDAITPPGGRLIWDWLRGAAA